MWSISATIRELLSTQVRLYVSFAKGIGVNEYDMVEVKVLKKGGKPIPGNGIFWNKDSNNLVTLGDLYTALGERLKKIKMDFSGKIIVNVLFTL